MSVWTWEIDGAHLGDENSAASAALAEAIREAQRSLSVALLVGQWLGQGVRVTFSATDDGLTVTPALDPTTPPGQVTYHHERTFTP